MKSEASASAMALAAAGIVGIWSIDPRQGVRLDQGAAQLLGRANEFVDKYAPILISSSRIYIVDHESVEDYWRKLAQTGGVASIEFRVVDREGDLRWILCRGLFAPDKEGVFVGHGVMIDTTDHPMVAFRSPRNQNTVSIDMARSPGPGPFEEEAELVPSDPLLEAAARSVEVRTALSESGHGALRLAADLLLWEINTALAERYARSETVIPSQSDESR